MGRRILFITSDQQRYDTLGCNGGELSRTPTLDRLASEGLRYERAIPQSVVCMPSRSTMLTGQYPSTHGVWMNGVALPDQAPSVAEDLHAAGYRTGLIGKPHFEPFLDPFMRFAQNRLSRDGLTGTYRGFEHLEFATHGARGPLHYADWLLREHPEAAAWFYPVLDGALEVNALGGGDTGAPQVWANQVPREWYHTDWVADRTIAWLDSLDADEDWFCWMSFPDPHHPWDPPASEVGRVDWREVPLPAGYPTDAAERERILDDKPRHWGAWFRGEVVSNYEAPLDWVPATLTPDQIREVNALNAVEVELIDEAIGRVLGSIEARGWTDDVDIIFTTDHGELQGDFGLLFKGPYHVDGLMRLPLIWRPAPSANIAPQVIERPVGLIDLVPTFTAIAGIDTPASAEGAVLPINDTDPLAPCQERVLTEWDSVLFGVEVHLRTITRDGWVCTWVDGDDGELYHLGDDPLQQHNRWNDPAVTSIRDDLLADLWDHQPAMVSPLPPVQAPV